MNLWGPLPLYQGFLHYNKLCPNWQRGGNYGVWGSNKSHNFNLYG